MRWHWGFLLQNPLIFQSGHEPQLVVRPFWKALEKIIERAYWVKIMASLVGQRTAELNLHT